MPKRTMFVTEIDPAELAIRMCEAAYGLKRPPMLSAMEALAAMDEDSRDRWVRAANAAWKYLQERLEAGQAPS